MLSPLIATAELTPRHQGARSKSGISPQRPCFTVSCDDWTFHTVKLFLRGRQPVELIRDIRASVLEPDVRRMQLRDKKTGCGFTWGYTVTMHFYSPENTRLLSLREITARMDASLQECPWLCLPNLSVSRLDLASDHLVRASPGLVCDLIAEVNPPHSQRIARYRERGDSYHTVYHVSGRRSTGPIPFGEHHRKGKQPVVVAHYPRLEALLERSGPEGVSESAVAYTKDRVREEARFRREAIRRYIGPGSAGLSAVLGSLPAFVRAAHRRLRPIVGDAGIISFPRIEGEAALPASPRDSGETSAQHIHAGGEQRARIGVCSARVFGAGVAPALAGTDRSTTATTAIHFRVIGSPFEKERRHY